MDFLTQQKKREYPINSEQFNSVRLLQNNRLSYIDLKLKAT